MQVPKMCTLCIDSLPGKPGVESTRRRVTCSLHSKKIQSSCKYLAGTWVNIIVLPDEDLQKRSQAARPRWSYFGGEGSFCVCRAWGCPRLLAPNWSLELFTMESTRLGSLHVNEVTINNRQLPAMACGQPDQKKRPRRWKLYFDLHRDLQSSETSEL